MAKHTPASAETCLQIIDWIAKGCTVKAAVEEVEPVVAKRDTLTRNFYAAVAKCDNLAQSYARAQKSRAQAHFERIGDIAEQVLTGALDPQAARVAIDAWKWTAGRMDPRKYGDKVLVEDATPKATLSREEIKAQLLASGLRASDIFDALTKRAEPMPLEIESTAQPAEAEELPE